jgi:large subunit ribosomal protein L32e
MGVRPIQRKRSVHKRTARFTRFASDMYDRLKSHWRRPRGIDNRMRRQFRGNKPLVSIGYGTAKKTRFYGPNGLKRFLITNESDLELLLMNNRVYAGEIASNLSARKRKTIVQRAKQLNVSLTNAKARIAVEEKQVKKD